jgi:hypothetical protein
MARHADALATYRPQSAMLRGLTLWGLMLMKQTQRSSRVFAITRRQGVIIAMNLATHAIGATAQTHHSSFTGRSATPVKVYHPRRSRC